jgi:hypothetical protein
MPKTFEETLDSLTDIQRAYIAASLDAFEATLPDGESVTVEDLDDDALATLIAEADALPDMSETAVATAGAAVATRYYLSRTGNPALPHTCRTTLLLVDAPAECEDPDCTGCAWCDQNGITVPPLEAIARLIRRHNTDESFTIDAEQVLEQIERIVANAAPVVPTADGFGRAYPAEPLAFRASGSRQACKSDLVDIARALGADTDDRASVETLRALIAIHIRGGR